MIGRGVRRSQWGCDDRTRGVALRRDLQEGSVTHAPAPPDCPSISKSDLQPGDVLLSTDTGWIDEVIRHWDEGIYSHSAMWDGTRVVEATLGGVHATTLEDEQKQAYVDAYRWQSMPPHVHVLREKGYPSEPVTAQTDIIASEGPEYAYIKLMVAALVIGLSKVKDSPRLAVLKEVRYQLGRWIDDYIDRDGKKGMTCTEVVCTSFWQADPQGKYAINIDIDGSRDIATIEAVARTLRGVRPRQVPEYDELKEECLAQFLRAASGVTAEQLEALAGMQFRAFGGQHACWPAGGRDLPASLVTPRDLQQSPDLKCVGRLCKPVTGARPEAPPPDPSPVAGRS
jgi:hypothetical protein